MSLNNNDTATGNELQELSAKEILLTTSMEDYAALLQTQRRNSDLELNALKGSVAFSIIKNHLYKMLDELEAYFNRLNEFESVEFAINYVDAATAAKALGRKNDIIIFVHAWIDSQDSLNF